MTAWIIGHQSPLYMEFYGHGYWGGLPFPTPGDLPDPGTEPMSFVFPALASVFFATTPTWKPIISLIYLNEFSFGFLLSQLCLKNTVLMNLFKLAKVPI